MAADADATHLCETVEVPDPKQKVIVARAKSNPRPWVAVDMAGHLPGLFTASERDFDSDSSDNSLSPRKSRELPPRPVGVGVPCGMFKSMSAVRLAQKDSSSAEPLMMRMSRAGTSIAPPPPLEDIAPYIPVLRSGAVADIGRRSSMEDSHVQIDDVSACLGDVIVAEPTAFYGVFDGHGGAGAALFASEELLGFVVNDPSFPQHLPQAFRSAFEKADRCFELKCSAGHLANSGTTALAALVSGRLLVVANVGDCRAVLSRRGKAVDLSNDQKASSLSERARILAAGGFVDSDNYLNGHLAVSRALGDWHFQDLKGRNSQLQTIGPLTSEPEIREAVLSAEDEFLILGCDGLWDVFTSQLAVEYARKRLQQHNDPKRCCQELVDEALRRSTTDNLTVVIVCFGESPPPPNPGKFVVKRSISADGLQRLQGIIDSG